MNAVILYLDYHESPEKVQKEAIPFSNRAKMRIYPGSFILFI
jgi:hypothetical protein